LSPERLFFAFWPDDDIRAQLVERARAVQAVAEDGSPVPDDNFHITLRFLGALKPDECERAELAASRVRKRDMTLVVDQAGFWPQPRVLWIGCSDVPDPVLGLVADINTELGGEGFEFRTRSYRPHVTVARGVTAAGDMPRVPPLHWTPERFALVRSDTRGSVSSYEVVGEWPLL